MMKRLKARTCSSRREKPETGVPSEPVVNDEEVKNEKLVVIEGPKPQTAGLTEVEVVAAEPSHENESELTDAILEPQLDVVDEEDDPFHDDEPTADGQPIHDYSSYNKINLINTLRKIIGEGDVEVIKPHADAIKACLYKIRSHEIDEQKAVFIAGGNDEGLFLAESDSYELELKDLFREYKNLRYESTRKWRLSRRRTI